VRFLSGGERQRVLLARLFAKPANVIVLDEPTNDLDAETLELLEERLVEFSGTVLLVSHDRAFLDNVVTSTLVFEPAAAGGHDPPAWTIREYVGGYADWLRQRPAAPPERRPDRPTQSGAAAPQSAAPTQRPRKLSFKEQQELAALPARIEALEIEIAARHAAMANPDYYRQAGDVLAREQGLLANAEAELAEAFVRWEALERPGA
jgi:ATP-binding cassette subfamily F protein uup